MKTGCDYSACPAEGGGADLRLKALMKKALPLVLSQTTLQRGEYREGVTD